jgi:hypothetical protein
MNPTSVHQIDAWRAAKSETEHLEFKEAKNQFSFDDLLSYCVAIGNEGGGHLLLGIANKPPRPVVGTNAYPNVNKIAEQLLNKLHFRVDVEEVNHPGGRVLVFHIPSRPVGQPFTLDGAYYMRSGESLVAMTPDQLRKIFNERRSEQRRTVPALILLVLLAGGFAWYRYRIATRPPSLRERNQSVGQQPADSASVLPATKPEKSKTEAGAPSNPNPKPKQNKKVQSLESKTTPTSRPSEPRPRNEQNSSNTQSTPLQQSPAVQVPTAVPQTFKDRVIQRNKNSPAGDRERLANAFFEFSESLDQGSDLMYKGFHESSAIGTEGANVVKDLEAHITKLHGLASSAKEYGKANMALRTKWSYYPEQTQYVFGDNPDNLGWGKLANAFDGYAYHLETWGVIQNKDDKRVVSILAEDRTQFEALLNEYSLFYQGCKARLEEMKAPLQ